MEKKIRHKSTIRSQVLTLRMTEEEMLRFKVAALGLRKKRSKIVRERVADLINGTPPVHPVATPPAGGDAGDTVTNGTVANGLPAMDEHAEGTAPKTVSVATGHGGACS
jgi:hypothetical protein